MTVGSIEQQLEPSESGQQNEAYESDSPDSPDGTSGMRHLSRRRRSVGSSAELQTSSSRILSTSASSGSSSALAWSHTSDRINFERALNKSGENSPKIMIPGSLLLSQENSIKQTKQSERPCFLEPTEVIEIEPQETDHQSADSFWVSWNNLNYVLETKWWKLAGERKTILSDLSGSFRSGQLTAVLGPSGAGKSTLIDCLTGRRRRGLTGCTRVHFRGPSSQRRPLSLALIPQKDHLLDALTVAETFMYASRIKNAHLRDQLELVDRTEGPEKRRKNPKAFDHLANVQRVLQQLHLTGCASVKCAKLSGGQYKRVSIGQELLSRPDVLVLDEPTSGLDAVTCHQTVQALRDLLRDSAYPMAIVATIHQPDVETFQLFDKAYVLAGGGRAIFEGPCSKILDTLSQGLELVELRHRRCEAAGQFKTHLERDQLQRLRQELSAPSCNPARVVVGVAAQQYGYELTDALNELQRNQSNDQGQNAQDGLMLVSSKLHKLTIGLEHSQLSMGPPMFDYEAHAPHKRRLDLDELLAGKRSPNSINSGTSLGLFLRHVWLHTSRSWLTIRRDPMLFVVQILLHILVPLLISYCFQRPQADACPRPGPLDVVHEAYRSGSLLDELNGELRDSFENLGYIFFQVYVIIFAAVCVTSLTYPLVMHVLLKEHRNGWYSLASYFLGRTLADLPVPTFNVTLALAISYHLTGQPVERYDWRFLSSAGLTVLATLVAQTLGLLFGALLMRLPQSAVFVAPASTAPLVVVSGFLLRVQSLPSPLQLLSRFSFFTHLLNGLIVSRYGFGRCPCDPSQLILEPDHELPGQARALLDLWLGSFATNGTTDGSSQPPDLLGKLVDTISRAKSFGQPADDCSQVKPFLMLDYKLEDSDLLLSFVSLAAMLLITRILTYLVLSWKVRSNN